MMSPDTLIATALFAACAVPLSLWIGLGRKREDIDDAAAAVATQPDALAQWPAKHFISVCMYCARVTKTDTHAPPVRVGDELRVSHGYCMDCLTQHHPQAAAEMLEARLKLASA